MFLFFVCFFLFIKYYYLFHIFLTITVKVLGLDEGGKDENDDGDVDYDDGDVDVWLSFKASIFDGDVMYIKHEI